MEAKTKPNHIGRKIGRVRELVGIKRESLAEELGISQQAVSKIEQGEEVGDTTWQRIAKALGVNAQAIKNFNDETLIFHIDQMHDQSSAYNNNCTLNFNPIDKWLEAIEENKKLYKALLKSEREKVALLEKMLGK